MSGDTDPATLAAHFVAGRQADKAGQYYLHAASQASDALAFEKAAELYRRAGEIGCGDSARRCQLRWKTATALANAGRGAEAGAEYAAAAREAAPEAALEARRLSAMHFLFSGEVEKGWAMLKTVLAEVGLQLPRGPRHAIWKLMLQRTRLRLRGLRFRKCSEEAVDPQLLQRIDICWSAAAGLSVVDPIAAAVFQTHGLLLAVQRRAPTHCPLAVCRSSARFARGRLCQASSGSVAGEGRDAILSYGEPARTRIDSAACGVAATFQGRWRAATEFCDKAESTFREQCTGVAWELDCATACAASALFDAGEVVALAQPASLARPCGETRQSVCPDGASCMNLPEWAADDPAGAERNLESCMQLWTHKRFHVAHLSALYDQVQTDLYRGDPGSAWQRIAQCQGAIVRSMLMRVQLSRASPTRHARSLRWPWPMSARILGPCSAWLNGTPVVSSVRDRPGRSRWPNCCTLRWPRRGGRSREAIALLEKAVVHFQRVDMVLYAAVAPTTGTTRRWTIGQRTGPTC